jgi:hypothetical protein
MRIVVTPRNRVSVPRRYRKPQRRFFNPEPEGFGRNLFDHAWIQMNKDNETARLGRWADCLQFLKIVR